MSIPTLSPFAKGLKTETAFDVLALAKALQAKGKKVFELQIGDSPFATPSEAVEAGVQAIHQGQTHYCPSTGLVSFRETIAGFLSEELAVPITTDEVVVASGAKVFETFFCEAFLDQGDGVLVFSPFFPTYPPNIARRGARMVTAPLRAERSFRPDPADVAHFLATDPKPRAIFLNSPHNPTGGVATREDLEAIAKLISGKDIALFSDEPYCHMVWEGEHVSPLQIPSIRAQTVACYTFSKSYSMSGWRLGYAVAPAPVAGVLSRMINTTSSCTPPFVQAAGQAALKHSKAERERQMGLFGGKVRMLCEKLKTVPGVTCEVPKGTFYAFPGVQAICERLGITSHGLALYLLEGADEKVGLACLGGECFGDAGFGFLRFSCAGSDEVLSGAVDFFADAITRTDRVQAFLKARPEFQWKPK